MFTNEGVRFPRRKPPYTLQCRGLSPVAFCISLRLFARIRIIKFDADFPVRSPTLPLAGSSSPLLLRSAGFRDRRPSYPVHSETKSQLTPHFAPASRVSGNKFSRMLLTTSFPSPVLSWGGISVVQPDFQSRAGRRGWGPHFLTLLSQVCSETRGGLR